MNELTKTERDIAVAQIIDRMTRYTKAIGVIQRIVAENEDGINFLTIIDIARRFEIPPGVCLLFSESDGDQTYIAEFKPWITRWVSGSLKEADVHDMNFYFDVINEMDHCWIFMDKPSYYCGGGTSYWDGKKSKVPKSFNFDEQLREWASVGMRSTRKYNGPSFADVFLQREGFSSLGEAIGMRAAASVLGVAIDTRAELTRSDGKKIRIPMAELQKI